MAGDEVVHSIANGTGNDPGERRQPPRATHVPRNPETRRRTDQHALLAALGGTLNPDHRIDVHGFGMTRANLTAHAAVERSKTQRMLPLMPEDELHRLGAEAAGAIVQEKRRLTA